MGCGCNKGKPKQPLKQPRMPKVPPRQPTRPSKPPRK